jgi:hypothetical protein
VPLLGDLPLVHLRITTLAPSMRFFFYTIFFY